MKRSIRLTSLFTFLFSIVLLVCSQTRSLKIIRAADGMGPQSRIGQTELGANAREAKIPSGRAGHGLETTQVSPPANASMMQMPLVAPLFIEDADFSSTLVMVNASSLNTFADVVLTGMDGVEITSKRVQFTSHSQQRITVGALLHDIGSDATTGRIEIMQSPDLKGMSILAQLLLTHDELGEPNYIDEEIAMPSTSGSQMLRAVADKADGSPFLAITSLFESPQRITVECLPEHGPIFSKAVDLQPGETLVTEACIAKTLHGLDFTAVQSGAVRGSRGSVGIALSSDAMPGSFAAFGLAPHEDRGRDFFSGIVFDDPKMIMSSTTVFPGVPVGSTDLLPTGNFIPSLALANFSTQDAKVHVRHAFYSGSVASVEDVRSVVIPAGSSMNFSFENLAGDPGVKNSFLVTSEAAPGDIMSKLVSRSHSALREVELLGKDEKEHVNGGSHPWNLQGETESTLLLFNHSAETQTVDVFISRPDVPWHKAYHLGSMQMEVIDFRTLLREQVKDDQGRTLPENILAGQVGWFASTLGSVNGRILQSDRGQAMARSFSCTESYALAGALFSPNTTSMDSGQTVTFGSVVGLVSIPVSGELGSCGGTPAEQGGSYSISWTTDDPNTIAISGSSTQASVNVLGGLGGQASIVATLTDPNFGCIESDGGTGTVHPKVNSISPTLGLVGTDTSVTITGAGFTSGATPNAGSNVGVSNISVLSTTQIRATFTPTNSSSAGGSQTVTVTAGGVQSGPGVTFYSQIPSSLTVVGTPAIIGDGSPGGCTAGDFGIRIDIKYQVFDQQTPAQTIQSSNMIPFEDDTFPNGTQSGDTCANSPVPDCTLNTASDGTYHDAPVGFCNSGPLSNFTETQKISMLIGSVKYQVRTNNFTMNSSSSGHGSITNGGDINRSR